MNSRSAYHGVIACFFLSGFAALLYQVAWLRQFSFVFGTSELAVVAVLAAYMSGLAAGAAIAGRLIHKVRRPVLIYGVLEAGIAVSALAVPFLLAAASWLYTFYMGDQPSPPDTLGGGQSLFYFVSAFVVLAIPTGFMGATLPILTRYAVHSNEQLGPRVALLYATNTFGAVAGVVLAGFLLLPSLGLSGTVWTGVAINALVFVIAVMIAKQSATVEEGSAPVAETSRPISFYRGCLAALWQSGGVVTGLRSIFNSQPAWILPLILISGANVFVYEVLWTRMLVHVLGSSIYAFATMLSAFLAGIALGGGIAGKLASDRNRSAILFAGAQVLIGLLSVAVYAWMGPLIPVERSTGSMAFFAVAIMLPATVFIGATFPLAVRILARNESEAAASTAVVYAWNTVGAVGGVVLAGFWLIPTLGFEGTIRWAVGVNLVLALWAFLVVAPRKLVLVGVTSALLLSVFVFYKPARPEAVISRTVFEMSELEAPRELFYSVGQALTVLLLEDAGYFLLRTNGLPEASILARGGVETQNAQKLLAALPVIARPEARSMLLVGFGGGVVIENVPGAIEEIDVIELEPEVIEANRILAEKRNADPLSDSRVNIVINDARNALTLTSKKYDIIVSQPPHPWTSNASHLYTREFLAEVQSNLARDGVFIQRVGAEFLTESLLKILAATLLAEFRSVRLYLPWQGSLVFMASDGPLPMEEDPVAIETALSQDEALFASLGINGVEDLLAALALDQRGMERFARRAAHSTDNMNLMATASLPFANGLNVGRLLDILGPYSPFENAQSWVYTKSELDINFAYLARRLAQLGQLSRIVSIAGTTPDRADSLVLQGLARDILGEDQFAITHWAEAIAADHDSFDSRYFIIKKNQELYTSGQATIDQQVLVDGLPESARAVVAGWSLKRAGNWLALAGLDDPLSQSDPRDAWFVDAMILRAEWRLNLGRPEEALELVNRAVILEQDPALIILRAMSAAQAGDAETFVETARHIATSAENTLRILETSDSGFLLQQLAGMRQNLLAIQWRLGDQLMTNDPEVTIRMQAKIATLMDEINAYLESVGITL